jgi:NurA-like 5'-3' nuclease
MAVLASDEQWGCSRLQIFNKRKTKFEKQITEIEELEIVNKINEYKR